MSEDENPFIDCGPSSSTGLKRSRSWASITNAYSAKKRRISHTSIDFTRVLQDANDHSHEPETAADRFVPARPKTSLPLQSTPRTRRIGTVFGLADERILNFADPAPSTPDSAVYRLLRKSASQLFHIPSSISPISAAANLSNNKQFLIALDGPGVPSDVYATPLTWSLRNYIAVACGADVYYQNLDSRSISHLCKLSGPYLGRLHSIEWGGDQKPDVLALGTDQGAVQLWDSVSGRRVAHWSHRWDGVGGMNWRDAVLAVGHEKGGITMYDARAVREVNRLTGHKGQVHAVRWSLDGKYLASGDHGGSVFIWDLRAGKSLTDTGIRKPRMKHRGPVKALSWCPWKPDLLATGSMFPEGTLRIWSATSTSSPFEPLHTIDMHTSITSLHWSPHCKELLSTHGSSWAPLATETLPKLLKSVPGRYTNSITVMSYPSCNPIVSVTAHTGVVGHSNISPDGTKVFTVCPAEEAMKMWKVWALRPGLEKRDSVFDKCVIR